MEKSKFKVGDRVRVGYVEQETSFPTNRHNFTGEIATINKVYPKGIYIHKPENAYAITFDNKELNSSTSGESYYIYYDSELLIARVKDNKLNRKLYPNATKEEGFLLI